MCWLLINYTSLLPSEWWPYTIVRLSDVPVISQPIKIDLNFLKIVEPEILLSYHFLILRCNDLGAADFMAYVLKLGNEMELLNLAYYFPPAGSTTTL